MADGETESVMLRGMSFEDVCLLIRMVRDYGGHEIDVVVRNASPEEE